jgi:hypothetical protein
MGNLTLKNLYLTKLRHSVAYSELTYWVFLVSHETSYESSVVTMESQASSFFTITYLLLNVW